MIRHIYAFKKLTSIIMLSHMRANTSLFGHILGSNPEINGYYEMHIDYYSWKSLIRQKLNFLERHKFKKKSRYIFDKVLHNEHYVDSKLLINKKAKVIISLRSPEETIPSIIQLYKDKIDPNHEFATLDGAINYYKNRLQQLEKDSKALKNKFIYLDANSIKENTTEAFLFLEKELMLTYPLSTEYNLQELTGAGNSGDHSDALKQGKIIRTKSDYSGIKINVERLANLTAKYNKTRAFIMSNSKQHL